MKDLIGQILIYSVLFLCSIPLWIHPVLTCKSWWEERRRG